jgi:Tol biopolymer transport system component
VIGGGARGILRVSENGGAPEQLVSVKQGELAAEPQVLPGGETVLFTLLSDTAGPRVDDRWDRAKVVVQSLKTGQRTSIVESGSDARYLPTGHLVYVLGGTVFAVPFDRRGLKITGVPVPVLEGVRRDTSGATGVAQFSLSDTGSLIFIPGPATLAGSTRTLILADRAGTTPVPIPSGTYTHPRVSRDGKLVAVEKDDGQEANVWIYDLSTATSNLRRLTFGGHNRLPVWSGDGQRVAFQSDRDGDAAIFAQRADGSGAVERLTKAESGVAHMPESWSPDGRTVLFSARKDATFSSWALSLIDRTAQRFGNVQSAEPIGATFSPDGHWVAYSSNDMPGGALSPNRGVYVQPFPATGVRYQVPKDSRDFHPAWGATEHQLFYAPSAGRLAVVNMQTQPTVTFGRPASVPSSAMESRLSTNVRDYDVMPNGRVLTIASGNIDQSSGRIGGQVQVVLNWTEELKQRVPTK